MVLTNVVRRFCDSLLSVAYPQVCLLCGLSVESRELGIACSACWNQAKLFDGTESICWKCGVTSPTKGAVSNQHLVSCHRCDELFFTAARSCGVYEGVLRESVLKLKREPYLSTKLLELLIETARRPPLDLSTRVMPVPLHPRRRKARGFNQASVIATRVARALQLPLDDVSLVRTGLFEKYRAGLDARGRDETVRGVFEARLPGTVKAEDILLVDDVFTTGSTVSNCAEALRSAGARNVYVLTVARPAY